MLPQKQTSERIVRSGWEGFAFPKHTKVKTLPEKPKTTEQEIEAGMDEVLKAFHIPNIRLPQMMFVAILKSPLLSGRMKGFLLDGLSGWPDRVCILPIGEYEGVKFCVTCLIENKTETGKLHGKQKEKNIELGFNISRNNDTAISIIKTFKKFHEYITKVIRLKPSEVTNQQY